jgi:hypothetical protein
MAQVTRHLQRVQLRMGQGTRLSHQQRAIVMKASSRRRGWQRGLLSWTVGQSSLTLSWWWVTSKKRRGGSLGLLAMTVMLLARRGPPAQTCLEIRRQAFSSHPQWRAGMQWQQAMNRGMVRRLVMRSPQQSCNQAALRMGHHLISWVA